MHVRVLVLVELAHAVEHLAGLLGRGGGVEEGDGSPVEELVEDREVRAQAVRVERGKRGGGHTAIVARGPSGPAPAGPRSAALWVRVPVPCCELGRLALALDLRGDRLEDLAEPLQAEALARLLEQLELQLRRELEAGREGERRLPDVLARRLDVGAGELHELCEQPDPTRHVVGVGRVVVVGEWLDRAGVEVLLALVMTYLISQITGSLIATRTMQGGQRGLMLALPLLFVGIVARFPAGLAVYWITTSLWTLGQQFAFWRLERRRVAGAGRHSRPWRRPEARAHRPRPPRRPRGSRDPAAAQAPVAQAQARPAPLAPTAAAARRDCEEGAVR